MHRIFTPLILILLVTSGCTRNVDGTWKAPFVYRIDVQQGNVVDQDMINKLRPGMDKNQVKYVMGTPLITDPFHNDRWDYVYIMEPGGGKRSQRHITLFFENEKLAHIEGDITIADRPSAEEIVKKERSVVVPTEEYTGGGFFSKLTGKDETEEAEEKIAEETEPTEEPEEVVAEEPAVTEEAEEVVVEASPAEVEPVAPVVRRKTDVTEEESDDDVRKETLAEKEQDKNLVKRFWERITSGDEESGIQKSGEASERELRDAEVLESIGGEL